MSFCESKKAKLKRYHFFLTKGCHYRQEQIDGRYSTYTAPMNEGERFMVELQKTKQKYFKDRTVYYSTFPIQEQAIVGADWECRT